MPPEPPAEGESTDSKGWAKTRVGPTVSALGPNALIGGGVAFQPIRWIELLLWGGYNRAEASGTAITSTAEAKISVLTGLARARVWLLERHSIVLDTGIGVTNYSMSASGYGTSSFNLGDSIQYKRSGTPVMGNIGAGYGFRSNGMFRVSVIMGVILQASKMNTGTVTSSSSFTAADREDLRVQLDTIGDDLTKPRPYLEGSFGFLF
jgi:hypothetical protein